MLCVFLWKKLWHRARLTFCPLCDKALKFLLSYPSSFADFFLHFIVNYIGNRYFKGAVDSFGFSGFFKAFKIITDICTSARKLACKVEAYFALGTANNTNEFFFRLLLVAPATASHRNFFLFQTFSPQNKYFL